MARLGSTKRPIMVRVPDDRTMEYVARTCHEHGWHYLAELAPDQPPDLAELEAALDPSLKVTQQPIRRTSDVGRNDPCPCGSGLKFKKCCSGKAPDPVPQHP